MKRDRSPSRSRRAPSAPAGGRKGRPVRPPTIAVGLTGGIGSGKSVVASTFGRLGALVVSADQVSKEILGSDQGVRRSVTGLLGAAAYGAGGKPDRKFIAARIYRSAALRRSLNAILHPVVIARIGRLIAAERSLRKHPMVVVEAALIVEAGMVPMFDALIVVDAPLAERVARIRRRDAIPGEDALRRVRSQKGNRAKAALADIVISNRGDLRSLRVAARFVYRLLAELPRGAR